MPTFSQLQSSVGKHSHVPMSAYHGRLAQPSSFLHLIWPANLVLVLSLLSCRLDLPSLTQRHTGIQKSRQLLTPRFAQIKRQLPKSWRNPKNLEISLGEGFCGSRGDVAFSLCLGQVAVLLSHVDLKWRSGVWVVFRVAVSICLASLAVWFCSSCIVHRLFRT